MKQRGKFKPMLAVPANYEKIKFPILVQPKLDGFRCLITAGIPVTRELLPIPNLHVQKILKGLPSWDGELMIKGGSFNDCQKAFNTVEGEPDFVFRIFDDFSDPDLPYLKRQDKFLDGILDTPTFLRKFLKPLTGLHANSFKEVMDMHRLHVKMGYEGSILRDPTSYYKYGRSTVNEGYLLKIKDLLDDEGILVDIEEETKNTNDPTLSTLGYKKRSTAKAGLIPTGTAGTFVILWKDKIRVRCGAGKGITAADRLDMWKNRKKLIGRKCTFSYQELTEAGKPRFPKFLGFRYD